MGRIHSSWRPAVGLAQIRDHETIALSLPPNPPALFRIPVSGDCPASWQIVCRAAHESGPRRRNHAKSGCNIRRRRTSPKISVQAPSRCGRHVRLALVRTKTHGGNLPATHRTSLNSAPRAGRSHGQSSRAWRSADPARTMRFRPYPRSQSNSADPNCL
jgi:hypothetical protein